MRQAASGNPICAACGAEARRRFAGYCFDCGKSLRESYQPLDFLRASYRLQSIGFQVAAKSEGETKNLFEKNENSWLELARAFLVYALVPYLGILFAPGAIVMSGVGAFRARRRWRSGELKSAVLNIVLSLLVCAAQILFWWLLYIVPELGRNF